MSGLVIHRARPGLDAIDEYSQRLAAALRDTGVNVTYVNDGASGALRVAGRPSFILLQYNPFNYGRRGFAPDLIRDLARLRRRTGAPLAIMVHEAWVPMTDWRTTLMGAWQRLQLRALLCTADLVLINRESLARDLGREAIHVPVASNITPTDVSPEHARTLLGIGDELVVTLFGTQHPSRALQYAERAIEAVSEARGVGDVRVLNLGDGAPRLAVPGGVHTVTPGSLSLAELSLHLRAGDLALLPFEDGLSTRRTTLMAALAHGLPVLGLRGVNTDRVLIDHPEAIVMTPPGDPAKYARSAADLATAADSRRALGVAGRALYVEQFDWPVLACRVASAVSGIRSTAAIDAVSTTLPAGAPAGQCA